MSREVARTTFEEESVSGRKFCGFCGFGSNRKSLFPQNIVILVNRKSFFPQNIHNYPSRKSFFRKNFFFTNYEKRNSSDRHLGNMKAFLKKFVNSNFNK